MSAPKAATVAAKALSGTELTSRRERAEERVSTGSYQRALEELEMIREALLQDPERHTELEAVERRIKEVEEFRVMADTRLRNHLEQGQFFLNHFQYLKAISVWESDPKLQKNPAVEERIAFSRAQMEKLEKGLASVKGHLEHQEPEAALVDLAKVHPLDPENTMLWQLEKNAQTLLIQKQVTALKEEALRHLEAENFETATSVLARIGELSQYIVTVRWLKAVRTETIGKLLPRIHQALESGDRATAERVFRWVFRLNSAEGSFDAELARLGKEFALSIISPLEPPPSPPSLSSVSPPSLPSAPGPLLVSVGTPGPEVRGRRYRRLGTLAAGAVLLLFGVQETYHLLQLRYVGRLRDEGRFEEAAEALDRSRPLLIGLGTIRELRREISCLKSISSARMALDQSRWKAAEGLLGTALENGQGLPRVQAEIEAVLGRWQEALRSLASSGIAREAWSGFEVLEKLGGRKAPDASEAKGAEAQRSYDLALGMAQAFLKRNALQEAISSARHAERYPPTAGEASRLLGEIRPRMLEVVEEALAAQDFDQAQVLALLLQSEFPELSVEAERCLRSVEFSRAMREARRALELDEVHAAREAYRRALDSCPEDEGARTQLRGLRDQLANLRRKRPDHQVLGSSSGDLAEAASIALNGHSRHRLSEEPDEVLTRFLYWKSLRGNWTMVRDPVEPDRALIVRGKVVLGSGEYVPPVGDIRIGIVLTNARGALLAGSVVKVPLLLPGGSQEFEVRLPSAGAQFIQLGIATP